jgi:hypothetical protein
MCESRERARKPNFPSSSLALGEAALRICTRIQELGQGTAPVRARLCASPPATCTTVATPGSRSCPFCAILPHLQPANTWRLPLLTLNPPHLTFTHRRHNSPPTHTGTASTTSSGFPPSLSHPLSHLPPYPPVHSSPKQTTRAKLHKFINSESRGLLAGRCNTPPLPTRGRLRCRSSPCEAAKLFRRLQSCVGGGHDTRPRKQCSHH